MSSKQLAKTVLDGRRVTFRFPSGEMVEGYLCGMDDYHWMVITSEGKKHLVHKGSASIIDLADINSYSGERKHSDLERVVGPFRRFMEAEFFGRTGASASDERAVS
jgi:hypothetical protein